MVNMTIHMIHMTIHMTINMTIRFRLHRLVSGWWQRLQRIWGVYWCGLWLGCAGNRCRGIYLRSGRRKFRVILWRWCSGRELWWIWRRGQWCFWWRWWCGRRGSRRRRCSRPESCEGSQIALEKGGALNITNCAPLGWKRSGHGI